MKRKEHTKTTTTKGAGVTERLARAAATHPLRTIAVFVLLIAAALLGAGDADGHGASPRRPSSAPASRPASPGSGSSKTA